MELLKKGVVYTVPCMNCNDLYSKETEKNQRKKLVENYYNAVKREDKKMIHAKNYKDEMEWEMAEVLQARLQQELRL